MFVFPLLSFAVIWGIFYQATPRDLPVVICDQDGSALSRRIARMIDATPSMRAAFHATDLNEGRDLIYRNKAYAIIYLPRDLERDVNRRKHPNVICYYSNQILTPGSIVFRDFRKTVDTLSAGINLTGRERLGEMEKAALAHVEPMRIDSHILFNPYVNYVYFLASALLPTILQIFVLMVSVYSVGTELRERTAGDWLQTGGNRVWKAIAGKMIPYTVTFAVLAVGMEAVLFQCLGVPLQGNLWLVSLATLLMILSIQTIGLLAVSVTVSLLSALSFASLFSVPAFAFAGITFPTLGMTWPGKLWSWLLPLSHYLIVFVDQTVRGAPAESSLDSMLFLLLSIPVLLVVVLLRMRTVLCNAHYWGRP